MPGFATVAFLASPSHADWLRFRGPNGTGVSPDSAETPTEWSPDKNIAWKAELPGPGVSSPIVVGDKVFVTCYTGYGLQREDPGDINNLKRHLLCFDRNSGKEVWRETVDAVQPEDPYSGIGVTAHGYASHTPASDGQHVYAFFGKSGVIAYDLDGNEKWKASVGTDSDSKQWGSSSSPIVHNDHLIVTASSESRSVVALNKKTGEEVWRQKADGLDSVWGTPIIVDVDKERSDLVLGVPFEFWGLNPENGKLRWYAEIMDTDQYSSSVVEADGVLYGIEGRGGGSVAIRAGGKKDVTDSHTVWSGRDSSRFGSPLVIDGRIYFFANGLANCISAEDGSEVFKERLPGASSGRGGGGGFRGGPPGGGGRPGGFGGGSPGGGPPGGDRAGPPGGGPPGGDRAGRGGPGGGPPGGGRGGFGGGRGGRGGGRGGFGVQDYASAVAADGKIYYLTGGGTTYVLNASDEFELLASNKVTEDEETFGGTPAISDGQIILRSNKHLYCIDE